MINTFPVSISQRAGESILYTVDVSSLLSSKELVSEASCTETSSCRSRKGKYVELRISKHMRNSTAQYEDYTCNIVLTTSENNIRLVPLKVRITK